MKKALLLALGLSLMACSKSPAADKASDADSTAVDTATVYFTADISPEGLMRVYEALGVKPEGRVAVKISTARLHITHRYLRCSNV